MKKLATIVLVAVLVGSFMIGAFADKAVAKNTKVTPQCIYTKQLVCNMEDCRVYELWSCPYGLVLVWTGEFCPANSGCW